MADLRYIGKFGSADSNVCQVRIHDSEFDGDPTEFPLQTVKFIRGRRGIHIFTPIRASSVELVGYKLARSALDELLNADVGRFIMEIWRGTSHASLDGGGGSRYWKGIVQTDLGEDDTVNPISNISITATDGLSLLRTIPYMDVTGLEPEPFTGRRTHLEVIRECMERIGYSLPMAISGRWYADDGIEGDILWEHAEADDRAFYDSTGRPASCYDVLKQILYAYGGIMFWRGGRMVVIQKEQIGAGAYTLNLYDEAGLTDGTAEYGETVDTADGHRLSGSRTYRTGYSSATVVYAHGNIPNLIAAGDFTGDAFIDPDDVWDYGFSGGEIRKSGGTVLSPPRGVGLGGVPRVEYVNVLFVPAFFYGTNTSFDAFRTAIKGSNRYGSQVGGEVRVGDIIALSARFRIPFNEGSGDGLFNTFFELQIGAHADGYMSRAGEWYTPSGDNDLQPLRQNGSIWNTQGFTLSRDPGDGWNEVLIISAPSPVAGAVRLVLYGTADINGSDMDPEGVEWSNVSILIVDEEGELRDSLVFTATNGTPEPADEDVVMLLGQGPHPGVPGSITWNGEDAKEWTDGESAPGDHYHLLLRKRLGYYGRRLELRYEKYDGINYEMGDPIEIDVDAYDVVFNEKDLASLEDVIEAVRIRFVDSDIVIAEVPQDRGTYVPGGTSSGVISAPAASLPIQELGDLIVGDADGNAIRLDSGADDGMLLVTDGEAEGGWSLVPFPSAAETPITTKGDFVVGDSGGLPARLPAPPDGKVWVSDSSEPLGWRAEDFSVGGGGPIERFFLPDITLDLVMLQAAITAFDLVLDIAPVTEAEIALGTVIT